MGVASVVHGIVERNGSDSDGSRTHVGFFWLAWKARAYNMGALPFAHLRTIRMKYITYALLFTSVGCASIDVEEDGGSPRRELPDLSMGGAESSAASGGGQSTVFQGATGGSGSNGGLIGGDTGGMTATGGGLATGGESSTGGVAATGGVSATGGGAATGGAKATGGSSTGCDGTPTGLTCGDASTYCSTTTYAADDVVVHVCTGTTNGCVPSRELLFYCVTDCTGKEPGSTLGQNSWKWKDNAQCN